MLATPPLSFNPGVETWKGEDGDDGWNCEKVERDVLKVAKEDGFLAEQENSTADDVPYLPVDLMDCSEGRPSFILTGMHQLGKALVEACGAV
eukprot:6191744-Pleurochrysis_carterae.AAC.3